MEVCTEPIPDMPQLAALRMGRSLCSISGVLDIFLEALLLRCFHRHQLDRQLINRPGEPKRWLVIVIVHPSAGIYANIEGLVDRLNKRNGARDRFAARRFSAAWPSGRFKSTAMLRLLRL